MTKILFIIRGVSGCGKSTAAEAIVGAENVATADAYFYKLGKERTGENGVYDFDPEKLFVAHRVCKSKVKKLMTAGVEKIAVANTSTRNADVNTYRKLAEEFGYMSIVLTVENRHGGKNLHGVPDDVLEKQEKQLLNSIQLRLEAKRQETFTVEEIKKYLLSQDSRGDILYNLSANKIKNANK